MKLIYADNCIEGYTMTEMKQKGFLSKIHEEDNAISNASFDYKSHFGVIDNIHRPSNHPKIAKIPFQQTINVEGYSKPMSVCPGDLINFHVSAGIDYQVTYLRLVDFVEGGEHIPLLETTAYEADFQPAPKDSWSHGCDWRVSFSLKVPINWPSGIYAAECKGSNGIDSYIVFIVKPKPNEKSYFAVLSNTNTWNAYNDWGGFSRYDHPNYITSTSFERPNPYASPLAPYDQMYVNHLTRSELWILKWLTSCGYKVDVYSDHDFHRGVSEMSRYKALIMTTHPEYWTIEMLDNLESYLREGGHLLYLGGNGIFERVEYSDASAARLIFLGGIPNQSRPRFYFRNLQPDPRPERKILGVAFMYDNYYSKPAPYQVQKADHRFFAGTNLQNGDLLGQKGLNGAASGREMDSSDNGTAKEGEIVEPWIYKQTSSGSNDRGQHPDNLQVLAKGTNERWIQEDGTKEGPHGAHLTYYDTDWGGWVLSAGSMTFGGSLFQDTNLQRIIKNSLKECLPANLSHLAPLLLSPKL